ncbi:hypothetical protein [Aquimarina mytili]|uniref:Uncharacterized protein n=1 Tax=Aquimarina mytili TaxID=874423 RepID=A0A937A6X9_9FLAO|nr:hypothetical protein [Aquimarina mytili]MBL0685384.1 hypothetical protein [Aquimarina mytili]
MKKKLEAELISIAHRILQGIDKSTLAQLQEESRLVYEKLSILNFVESHFGGPQPTIGQVRTALENKESDKLKEVKQKIKEIIEPKSEVVVQEQLEIEQPAAPKFKEEQKEEKKEEHNADIESKPELIIEGINARVTEDLFVPASSNPEIFEKTGEDEKPKSLNDQLRRDIHIGLNDRLAFIKYLFEGSATDYNRVLSQLNTLRTKNEAQDFIATMVKPDYHNWQGKEEYEERFMDIVSSKFEH